MLKKIFSPRNIIFIVIIVAFLAVLASQQVLLEQKTQDNKAAHAEQQKLADLEEKIQISKALSGSESSDEQKARDSGYIYPGEIVFYYD